MNRAKLLERLRSSLWFIPLLYAVLGLAISAITMFVDQRSDYQLVSMDFIGGPDAALAILGTVAASMVSLLATVLAITMVVVQLAMAQFSPRIVQTFLQDRPSQNAIGLFVATFVVAMLSMRGVQVGDDPVVPGFSVLVVFMLVVVDIVVLVNYIHHIGRSLRVSALIELVGKNNQAHSVVAGHNFVLSSFVNALRVTYNKTLNDRPLPEYFTATDLGSKVYSPLAGLHGHQRDRQRLLGRQRRHQSRLLRFR